MKGDDGAGEAWRQAVAHVANQASGSPIDSSLRVTLHFHPDRVTAGVTTLDQIALDGRYRSQFETGTSNGGLTAHPGGDRWRWESRLFDGAYDSAPSHERPVYGSLNHRQRSTGGSPRFGSAFFRLSPEVMERTTLCFPDSAFDPTNVAVPAKGSLLTAMAEASDFDDLDDYVEAQIHGGVVISGDVDALVLDPCYSGTSIERSALQLPCDLEWHHGYRLSTETLIEHTDYRGQAVAECGLAIARDGWLDPLIIGEAANTGRFDTQLVKKVWHCTARFGRRNTE